MKRQTRQFLNLADRLDRELDRKLDLFLQERPYLNTHDVYLTSKELHEAREENTANIHALIEELNKYDY